MPDLQFSDESGDELDAGDAPWCDQPNDNGANAMLKANYASAVDGLEGVSVSDNFEVRPFGATRVSTARVSQHVLCILQLLKLISRSSHSAIR
jgi:hypothetical protein